jgi:glyoxylase-like metal-dependent hydrolase (beta-lactamase superfamily II)
MAVLRDDDASRDAIPQCVDEGASHGIGGLAETDDVDFSQVFLPADLADPVDVVFHGGVVINIFETPGHASSHLCYQIGNLLFLGEVAGINYPLDQALYLRIATPPPFIHEIYRASLEKAASLNVSHACFGHYGYRKDVRNVFDTALNQLDNWMATVEKHIRAGSDPFDELVYADLLKNDRGLSPYYSLPKDVQSREKIFSVNSIKGMKDYLENK